MSEISSVPTFSEFSPDHIPYQRQVIDLIDSFDYSSGLLEILLSGSVGSAKSLIAAHCMVYHCLKYSGAKGLLGRKALPDLKETIFSTICEHIQGSMYVGGKEFIEGRDYKIQTNTASIWFKNRSRIISRSWSDKKYKKLRSLALSAAIVEELTENDDQDKEAYIELTQRMGRIPHIPETWIMAPTNPDGPEHWVYDRFIAKKRSRRKVFYSVTTDNPFLPKYYADSLKEDLDPKIAQRMIYGKWISITDEVVYHAYSSEHNFIDKEYQPDPSSPIYVGFDFNIGLNKPLSSVVMQVVDGIVHIFGETVIEGLRTLQNCEAMAEKGLLDHPVKYYVCGDASGKARDTRSNRSDYDLIKGFFANYSQRRGSLIDYTMKVPAANPPVRDRHNLVNAMCLNANGDRRLFVYKGAPTADKALRLTKLKKGSYIEDDSKPYQHIGTAIGYCLNVFKRQTIKSRQGTKQL